MTKDAAKGKFRRIKKLLGIKGHFISLNVKLTLVILLAAVFAVGTYAILGLVETQIGTRFFTSTKMMNQVLDDRYASLESYIKNNRVNGDDTALLQRWTDSQKSTEIVVYSNKGIQFTSGWLIDDSGRVRINVHNKSGTTANSTGTNNMPYVFARLSIDISNFKPDHNNRVIQFNDKPYYVYMNVHNETSWYSMMNGVSMVLSVFVFFLVILLYNKSVIKQIIDGSNDVRAISEGDLEHPVQHRTNDEIGKLSDSVEILRKNLQEKTAGEQAALDANTELITSMSHDIRTPLTSLIGYIDIIAGGKYQSQEELDRYIHSCKDKAVQLKDLSDKLFNYFLVFGNQEADIRTFENIDGSVLFRQLIGEHEAELEVQGFDVNVQFDVPEGIILRVDIPSIMRVFDNLFSNMRKYASEQFPIEIRGVYIQNKIKLVFQNHIRSEAKLVESTKIGVKTCKKICEDHGAAFHAMEEERIYTTEILFKPADVVPESEAAEVTIVEKKDDEGDTGAAETMADAEKTPETGANGGLSSADTSAGKDGVEGATGPAAGGASGDGTGNGSGGGNGETIVVVRVPDVPTVADDDAWAEAGMVPNPKE